MANFSKRNRDPELMDDGEVASDTLEEVFRDIDFSNRILGGQRATLNALDRLITEYPQKSYTIMDMGCGNGSMLREVVKYGRGKGWTIEAIGMDLSEKALAIARSVSQDFSEIRYIKQDILALKADVPQCDILLCTLTMHHFYDEDIPQFLQQFVKLSHIGVVINDLHRSPLAYRLFKGFSAIFIRTKIAKHDGLISIKSGFTKVELERFAEDLPGVRHEIEWKWAFRFVWTMRIERPTPCQKATAGNKPVQSLQTNDEGSL